MSAFKWCCRCVPGITLLLWIFLAYHVVASRLLALRASETGEALGTPKEWDNEPLDLTEWIYIVYSVVAHVCACIIFPARLIWAMWNIIEEIRLAKYEAVDVVVKKYEDSEASSTLEVGSLDDSRSLGSAGHGSNGSSITLEGSLSQTGTPKLGDEDDDLLSSVTHAIILPSYKEDMETMKETVGVLASHTLAKSSYDVYLAMEQRDPDSEWTARSLMDSFKDSFRNITFTIHPGDIEGEVAGKSSNVSWAARQASNNYTDTRTRAGCVITVMDSDTHLSSNYFLLLTKYHREDRDRGNTLYCVPIIFDRNAHKVNSFVRAADIFWCGAGLSGLYNGSTTKIPTSVYSIAMTLASHVGGWDSGPESIGEDMHMFLKCYFKSKGQVNTKVIYSPASQSNVHSDLKGVRGFFANLNSRYQQAFRHMWGSLDSGYAVQKGIEAYLNIKPDRQSEWLASPDPDERVPRWVSTSSLNHFTPPNVYDAPLISTSNFPPSSLISLYHRLYEAHFLPAHLTVALVSGLAYTAQIPSSTTHPTLLSTFDICAALRFVGFCATNVFMIQYEFYHKACLRLREDEMKRAGLYEGMEDNFARRDWRDVWTDYVALPVNGTLFGTIPTVIANCCHFFTDRLNYRVSVKPMGKRKDEELGGRAGVGTSTGTSAARVQLA